MSSRSLKAAIAAVVNDHTTLYDERVEVIHCLCGVTFPYYSRWAAHVADVVVDSVFGGDL